MLEFVKKKKEIVAITNYLMAYRHSEPKEKKLNLEAVRSYSILLCYTVLQR